MACPQAPGMIFYHTVSSWLWAVHLLGPGQGCGFQGCGVNHRSVVAFIHVKRTGNSYIEEMPGWWKQRNTHEILANLKNQGETNTSCTWNTLSLEVRLTHGIKETWAPCEIEVLVLQGDKPAKKGKKKEGSSVDWTGGKEIFCGEKCQVSRGCAWLRYSKRERKYFHI